MLSLKKCLSKKTKVELTSHERAVLDEFETKIRSAINTCAVSDRDRTIINFKVDDLYTLKTIVNKINQ